ncbi:MAG: hypothetical protein Q9183_001167, partial [Haloplaca sp. 2 TL-2023]
MKDGMLANRAYSGHGRNRANHGMGTKQEKANTSKSRWPHALNVVTNFSKPPQLAQRAADPSRRPEQDAVDGHYKGHKRSNSSTNMQTPETYEGKAAAASKLHHQEHGVDLNADVGMGFRRFEATRKAPSPPRDQKGPIHDLVRASSKMTTLSPSDRPIVIGISVPSDTLEQHTVSPDAGPTSVNTANKQVSRDRRPSEAPTIVVTPAKASAPWSVDDDSQHDTGRRRAPSSLYSRPTNAWNTPKPADVPPMPPAQRRPFPLRLDGDHHGAPNDRLISSYTEFDEDDSPRHATHERRYSGESQLRILKRSSTDSVATRHRSQGWWNHIVSPFLPRPGSIPWRSASRETEPVPDMPELAPSTSLTINKEPPRSSPLLGTRSRRSSSGHTSIWTDASVDEAEKQTTDLTMLRSPLHEGPRGLENPQVDLSDWFESLGAAAEYYHGCWHDQKYPEPYFECQNHVCVPRRLGNFPLPVDSEGQSRALAEAPGEAHGSDADLSPKHGDTSEDFQQAPSNRFSAAFQEAVVPRSATKERPLSETTVIDDVDATPIVQEARAAPVIRAPAPVAAALPPLPNPKSEEQVKNTPETPIAPSNDSRTPPPAPALQSPFMPQPGVASSRAVDVTENASPAGPSPQEKSPPRSEKPMKRFVAVLPPDHPSVAHGKAEPSKTASPITLNNGTDLSSNSPDDLSHSKAAGPVDGSTFVNPTVIHHHHYKPYRETKIDPVTLTDMEPPPRQAWTSQETTGFREKEAVQSTKPNKKRRGCPPLLSGCRGRGEPKTKKQKWILGGIASALLAMILVILLLALLLTRKGDQMEVQSQWLNLTGFPPVPTGVSTIVQPDLVKGASGCINPATLWSCAVPKEQQASIAPNAPDQPNFRIEIRFQNSSIAEATASNSTDLRRRSDARVGNAVGVGRISKRPLLHVRDFASNLFSPSPPPPLREDQIFLGNTTDQNQQPFDGVATPFFISFINPEKLASLRKVKRAPADDTNPTGNSTDPFPDLGSAIPSPSTNADGTASPALLTPLVEAQPLRLYDRNQDSEHYGFYTYFDRSIFLQSAALLNFNGSSPSELADDETGGAERQAAKVRCTWAQTRFLVQIWTRKGFTGNSSTTTSSPGSEPKNLTESSANNFTRPGSFPYPVSITLDRHGGDIQKKMIYCYGMDGEENIVSDQKQIQLEDRASGGSLVNPAQGPFGEVK